MSGEIDGAPQCDKATAAQAVQQVTFRNSHIGPVTAYLMIERLRDHQALVRPRPASERRPNEGEPLHEHCCRARVPALGRAKHGRARVSTTTGLALGHEPG